MLSRLHHGFFGAGRSAEASDRQAKIWNFHAANAHALGINIPKPWQSKKETRSLLSCL
jgi:hypothetical protein